MSKKHISEKLLEKRLVRAVKISGGMIVKLTILYETGWPDRLILWPGERIFFVELKSTGKDLSPRQKLIRRRLKALGFSYYKIDDEITLEKCLDDF